MIGEKDYRNGLYIEGKKADVDENEIFVFSYSNSKVSEPEAIKNSYSKSVNLKGTNTNNQIFGEIWNLDREIVEGGIALIGSSFNPKQRANFKLYDNGELLETGYICLDNITITKGVVVYSITLFGSLGDFFYNLMYNQDNEERSLADLQLGLDDETDDKKDTLLKWNKDYIKQSWDKLEGDFDSSDKSCANWITAAPTYSGLYDDFDNNKVLVEMDSLTDDVKQNLLPESFTKDGHAYRTIDGYGICGLQRDFSEWEARDLRSLYQRPAIRTKLAIDAICNPENNGGYEVKFDDEILKSPYYNESFIVTPRLEWEDSPTSENNINVEANSTDYPQYHDTFYILNKDGDTTFNLNGMNDPQLSLNVTERISLVDGYNAAEKIATCRTQLADGYLIPRNDTVIGGFLYNVVVRSNSNVKNYPFFVALEHNHFDFQVYPEANIKKALSIHLKEKLAVDLAADVKFICNNPATKRIYGNQTYYETQPVSLPVSLIAENNVTISIEKRYINMRLKGKDWVFDRLKPWEPINFYDSRYQGLVNVGKNEFPDKWKQIEYCETFLTSSYQYDGISKNVQRVDVTKQMLFGNLGSPYKILTDLCKQFNLRFRIENDIDDNKKGTVHIEQRKNYFLDKEVDINKQIDYSKDVVIIPTTAEYKFYKFGTENEDTYAYKLYKNKYSEDYSAYTYNSNYNFNSDTKDLFDGKIFDVGIDFRLNSPYFNTAKTDETVERFPQICLTPKYDWKLWSVNEESGELEKYGLQTYFSLPRIQDTPKMCLFDDEDKEVNMTVLCFFNGWRDCNNISLNNQAPYLLTDNLPIMNELNDEKPCFIYGQFTDDQKQGMTLKGKIRRNDAEVGVIGYWCDKLPIFSPNKKVFQYELVPKEIEHRTELIDDVVKSNIKNAYITTGNKWTSNSSYKSIVIPVVRNKVYNIEWTNTSSSAVGTTFSYGFCGYNTPSSSGRTMTKCVRSNPQTLPEVKDLAANNNYLVIQIQNANALEYLSVYTVETETIYEKVVTGSSTHESFYFKKPTAAFVDENYNASIMLYEKFWSNYINDLYNDNTKKVELYCFLKDRPQDALRKFYKFSNSIWQLNDITDYNYKNEDPVKCTFIKVRDIYNYLK